MVRFYIDTNDLILQSESQLNMINKSLKKLQMEQILSDYYTSKKKKVPRRTEYIAYKRANV